MYRGAYHSFTCHVIQISTSGFGGEVADNELVVVLQIPVEELKLVAIEVHFVTIHNDETFYTRSRARFGEVVSGGFGCKRCYGAFHQVHQVKVAVCVQVRFRQCKRVAGILVRIDGEHLTVQVVRRIHLQRAEARFAVDKRRRSAEVFGTVPAVVELIAGAFLTKEPYFVHRGFAAERYGEVSLWRFGR